MSQRHLAAIMFTDIVGYTKLMGDNEEEALQLLRKNRNLHKSIIKKHHGRWLKEMGDGTLASFKTISDAVYCAGELMKACDDEKISLRIGIHQGEVTMDNGDIFGDGVNVASRIEPLAQPGQILVSGPIHRNVKNKSSITSTYLGEKEFKNVDEPIRVYSVKVDSFSDSFVRSKTQTKKKPIIVAVGLVLAILIIYSLASYLNIEKPEISESVEKSIAVLPFKDMSPEQDQEYLGDGIAEDIINKLTRVEDLKVIGRTSSFSFKDKDTDLKTIGEMLGVETILEGSVQKSGNQLRITAQLINASDGFHIWSESFDREFSDVFSIQDELAHFVVTKMLDDPANENKTIFKGEIVNSEAYEYYLKGKYLHHNTYWESKEQVRKILQLSENLFFKALDLQEDYPLAHAGLADLYNTFDNNSDFLELDSIDIVRYRTLQKEHINKAYQLGQELDYVNQAKGWVQLALEEYDSAYQSFVKSVQLNKNEKDNLEAMAYFLQEIGLDQKALILYDKLKEIDPLDIGVLTNRTRVNTLLGNWSIAMNDLDDMILIEPNYIEPYLLIINLSIIMGDVDKAKNSLMRSKEINPNMDYSFSEGLIYAAEGQKEKAFEIRGNYAWYNALLGMREEYISGVLKWLSIIGNDNKTAYLYLTKNQYYDWIKDDPRVQEFVKKEKEKYDRLLAKYGNFDFLNL